mmetsp:Transcript_33136/g.63622  ORF Transcript_33136/g.63622 Transcript_33136/m.63622 type:complete len:87 (-) Transcript_33136:235-495(-)
MLQGTEVYSGAADMPSANHMLGNKLNSAKYSSFELQMSNHNFDNSYIYKAPTLLWGCANCLAAYNRKHDLRINVHAPENEARESEK